MTGRVAIFFAPPAGSELEAFGCRILGRSHRTGEAIEQPVIDGIAADDVHHMTRSTRRYGFHATLKAPFTLSAGKTISALREAMATFAAERAAFEAPPLRLSALSRWIAFKLSAPCPEMDRLAADCVTGFEPFRAPLDQADIDRRRDARLTATQDERMLAYGYPYIFEDFEFHMTLAGPLDASERDRVLKALERRAPAIDRTPLPVDAIALYEQPDRDSPFLQTARFPFGAR